MAHCPQRASEPALRAARAAAACVKRALAKTQSTSVEKDGGPFKAREKQVLVFQPPGKRGAKKTQTNKTTKDVLRTSALHFARMECTRMQSRNASAAFNRQS